MLWANPTRVMLVGGLGGAFVLIGKLFIVVADVIICYELLLNIEPYKSSLTSVILPCLLIFVIGYAIA